MLVECYGFFLLFEPCLKFTFQSLNFFEEAVLLRQRRLSDGRQGLGSTIQLFDQILVCFGEFLYFLLLFSQLLLD